MLVYFNADKFVINVMTFLDSRLNTDYLKFGHHLGIDMNELQKIHEALGHDTKRCIREVLFEWKRRSSPEDVTYEAIAKALEETGYPLLSTVVKDCYGSSTFCIICQTSHGGNIDDFSSIKHILTSKHCSKY